MTSENRVLDLLEENAEISRRLAESLSEQVRTLKAENEKLRESLCETELCNVIVFTSDSERNIAVASVTNCTTEGVDLYSRMQQMFIKNKAALHKRGIAFATITDVPLNQVHDTPSLFNERK